MCWKYRIPFSWGWNTLMALSSNGPKNDSLVILFLCYSYGLLIHSIEGRNSRDLIKYTFYLEPVFDHLRKSELIHVWWIMATPLSDIIHASINKSHVTWKRKFYMTWINSISIYLYRMSTLSYCMYIYIINKIYLLGEICPLSPKFGDVCLKKQTNKTKQKIQKNSAYVNFQKVIGIIL